MQVCPYIDSQNAIGFSPSPTTLQMPCVESEAAEKSDARKCQSTFQIERNVMPDFIEYVVAELKSKRLSKTDAAALIRQFSRLSSVWVAAVIHPLLHRNTSDLREQRYSSTFTGEEFFLADHQVRVDGRADQKVLPGVAYLEMARAAIEHALPAWPEATILELHNTVWAQPVVVGQNKQISIALGANDQDQIDYEIYSLDGEQEIVHCQGRAVWGLRQAPARFDFDGLKGQMGQGQIEPNSVYEACASMGLIYGPSLQAITAIHRGSGQVLAELRLPNTVADTSGDYVLHPSLMDGALQAAVGLIDGGPESNQTRLPFALETLRIVSPCSQEMVAWVRYAPGSQAADTVIKLDVDLCDERGNVCAQMHGVSWRALRTEISTAAAESTTDGPPAQSEPQAEQPVVAAEIETESLAEKTQDYLRRQLSELLNVPSQKIDPRAALEIYGIDSILAMKLTNQLEKTLGSLPKTLFFEYQTIRELAEYFIAHHSVQLAAQLPALLAPTSNRQSEAAPSTTPALPAAPTKRISSRRANRLRSAAPSAATDIDPIVIIGLSGRYPEAIDIDAFWHNLREGKDCIIEVPKERWDWREYFGADRSESGRHYSKWGGFIAGVDEFDPLFFNISPVDAELIDPQERLFLQHAWMAIEDAGYTRASLQMPCEHDLPGQVGVYVGVMYSEYQLFGAEAGVHGKRLGIAGSFASIANRVSYAFNLHGPSLTLDTMCSSSLTAIHLACQDLKLGRTSLAIAGGVNVSIHPNKYLVLSDGQFISSDGHCQSFGEGGDGYIPGEGVGVVVLKRLSEAKRDGDHIYGVIRGSALNHGGKTNGYTVPNPQAQASVISRALAESQTDPRHISYIEAHGTGTRLGDPIEIAALSKAFQQYTHDTEFCLIGSVKSNIGHCESAAGIAGLTKVLLQMRRQLIAPSLHSAQLNPHIDFPTTPFVVNQELRAWETPVIDGRTLSRIAGISSFGAGGSNAHLIVEEYQEPTQEPLAFANVVILLSARTVEQLRQKARDLLDFVLPRLNTIDLVAMAYTLQVGREAMEERLGFVVSSVQQLAEKLEAYVAGEEDLEDAYQGQATRNSDTLSLFSTDVDLQHAIDRWIANKKLSKLLELWVNGLELDWSRLYGEVKPRRLSLPTYPFATERYWIDTAPSAAMDGRVAALGAATAVLHPLLHSNTSDLSEQRYNSTFTGKEFFLADHQVAANGHAGQRALPAVAYLEMARAAIEHALPSRLESTVLELHNTVWTQPVVVADKKRVSISLAANDHHEIDYEIYSQEADQEIIHCQGRAVLSREPAPARLDLNGLKGQMERGQVEPNSVYATCARKGLIYGASFRGITAIHRGSDQVLAQLRLPSIVADTSGDYWLHPSMVDGALQAAVGLIEGGLESNHQAGQPRLPFALDSLRIVSPCAPEMIAWVRYGPCSHAEDTSVKLDIDLCDERGNVCLQLRGLYLRALSKEIRTAAAQGQAIGSLLATPVWQARSVEVSAEASHIEYAEHHVVLCELSNVNVNQLRPLLPHSQCLSLHAGEQQNVAQRYSEYALACFERIQTIFRGKRKGKALVQIVVGEHQEQALFTGLAGLLKTAALENPQLIGQLILVPAHITAEELTHQLEQEMSRGPADGLDTLIRYGGGGRQVPRQ